LKLKPDATPRQKVIAEILSGVERVRIDTEANLKDVLDKVHEISQKDIDPTHVFALSQAWGDGVTCQRRCSCPADA